MGARTIITATIVIALCVSIWTTASSPVSPSDALQSTADVVHHLQRREVMFRPLFVYRQQEIEKQRKHEARTQKQLEHHQQQQDYREQMEEYKKTLAEYNKQMDEYKQKQQQHSHHH
ncbi:sex-determining region Y protein-like isoform X2 [Malaya genurostris]|uniref:sex-determining region Y protein-like isoform X2 n=1 Tax=Malaya genurostris TaxID=325434 RepID=UPI0026F3DF68|nr:sex-determining region Y protein-like isoform X2 [Malaya genurostris]